MLGWFGLLASATLIFLTGPVLTRRAEALAGSWGLSRSWAGTVLLATVTSLPELITGISAIRLADAPNLAIGDALGSCVFNLFLLAVLDLLSREEPIYRRADLRHIVTAALGTILIGTVGAVLLTAQSGLDHVLGHVSIYTPAILLLYLVAVHATFRREPSERAEPGAGKWLAPFAGFALASVPLVAAGIWLPIAGTQIADAMGWRTSFVGSLLVAASTSLPEFAVMLAALRQRAVDVAIASLLGSNLFNMAIIAVDDLAYTKGSIFAAASPAHAGTAFAATIMSGIVIAAIIDRPSSRLFGSVGWVSLFLASIYVLSACSIYLLGH